MKKLSLFLVLISVSVFFILSCDKEPTTDAGGGSSSANTLRTTVAGIVMDKSNAPLSNVTVTAYGQTTTTNQYGIFVLKNLNANKDRCVLKFTKAGFFNGSHGFIASGNTVNYVRIVLSNISSPQSFSSSAGGTVSLPDGSSLLFQPNSFVMSNGASYTGMVFIVIKHLSPDDANFGFMIPGGDLLGKDLNNKDVALYSYGMLGVALTGSGGETLQLANNKTATLTMTIAASQLSIAPANIPLWYLDETTSLWKEEGTATKVGNNYVGTVKHFSWWNCDVGINSPILKGKVIDCNNMPVPNIIVTANGNRQTLTDQNGEYQGLVPSSLALTIQVLQVYNPMFSQDSQLENVPALSNNQTFIVPDLIMPCATPPTRVVGNLKTCSGENIEAMVLIRYSTALIDFQYTVNGDFNFVALQNAPVDFFAYNNQVTTHSSFTTLIGPAILNLGNILMCDTLNSNIPSQIFHENFENPDSVISYSSNISANAGWILNNRLKTSGAFSDSSLITAGDTTTLTTIPFSTIGYDTIILSFNHICKIHPFDRAIIEVSADNGNTWIQLVCAQYLGSSPAFCAQLDEFSSASYGDWLPGNFTAVPTNLWWKNETFDVTGLLYGSLNAKVRFVLYDADQNGSQ